MKYGIILLTVLTVALSACVVQSNPAPTGDATLAAPDFTVTKTSGEQFSLSAATQQDKPTVVYFMASSCSTCAKNWEAMNEVYPQYEGRVNLIAVSVDPTDTPEVLQKLAQEKGFVFDTVPGNPQLAVQYDVKKQTAKFAIDKDGNIVSRHDGALTAQEWEDLFVSLL